MRIKNGSSKSRAKDMSANGPPGEPATTAESAFGDALGGGRSARWSAWRVRPFPQDSPCAEASLAPRRRWNALAMRALAHLAARSPGKTPRCATAAGLFQAARPQTPTMGAASMHAAVASEKQTPLAESTRTSVYSVGGAHGGSYCTGVWRISLQCFTTTAGKAGAHCGSLFQSNRRAARCCLRHHAAAARRVFGGAASAARRRAAKDAL